MVNGARRSLPSSPTVTSTVPAGRDGTVISCSHEPVPSELAASTWLFPKLIWMPAWSAGNPFPERVSLDPGDPFEAELEITGSTLMLSPVLRPLMLPIMVTVSSPWGASGISTLALHTPFRSACVATLSSPSPMFSVIRSFATAPEPWKVTSVPGGPPSDVTPTDVPTDTCCTGALVVPDPEAEIVWFPAVVCGIVMLVCQNPRPSATTPEATSVPPNRTVIPVSLARKAVPVTRSTSPGVPSVGAAVSVGVISNDACPPLPFAPVAESTCGPPEMFGICSCDPTAPPLLAKTGGSVVPPIVTCTLAPGSNPVPVSRTVVPGGPFKGVTLNVDSIVNVPAWYPFTITR